MIDPRYRGPYLVDDPGRHPQETAFLTSILENPDDDTPRLVFADWLEEQGQADKAAFVRGEVEMSQLSQQSYRFKELRTELFRLDDAIGGEWIEALLRPGRLANCGRVNTEDARVRFAFECKKRWADLKDTDRPLVRYCDGCRKHVHFCSTKDEAERHAVKGDCIAVNSRLALKVRDEYALPDEEVMGLSVDVGEVLPDETWVDPMSPYYRWANEILSRHPGWKALG